MASHSLLDLVCQLQTFETKISEIVMEMALKLCALNDTKLFVILSTSMGRKVVGSPDLCGQFFQQQLFVDGTESYLELDPVRNALVEMPPPSHDRGMPVFPGGFHVGGVGGGGNSDGSRPRKRPAMDSRGGSERSKSPKLEFDVWDSEDAECSIVDVESPSTALTLFPPPSSSSSSSSGVNHPNAASLPGGPGGSPQLIARTVHPFKNMAKGNPNYELPENVRQGMMEFFAENQFAHAMLDCDGINLMQRETREHKVLTTLIMAYAKFCSRHCPVDKPDKTAFANLAFEIFWQHCPNLHPIENHAINNGHQNYSMRGYVKSRFSGRMYSISGRGQPKNNGS